MVNHVSHMLDDMIAVVDEGFSYDGIVSIPQTGLEDVEYRRSGMGDLLRGSVVGHLFDLLTASSCGFVLQDQVRKTGTTVSQRAARWVVAHRDS